jgi:hypothetical protein
MIINVLARLVFGSYHIDFAKTFRILYIERMLVDLAIDLMFPPLRFAIAATLDYVHDDGNDGDDGNLG